MADKKGSDLLSEFTVNIIEVATGDFVPGVVRPAVDSDKVLWSHWHAHVRGNADYPDWNWDDAMNDLSRYEDDHLFESGNSNSFESMAKSLSTGTVGGSIVVNRGKVHFKNAPKVTCPQCNIPLIRGTTTITFRHARPETATQEVNGWVCECGEAYVPGDIARAAHQRAMGSQGPSGMSASPQFTNSQHLDSHAASHAAAHATRSDSQGQLGAGREFFGLTPQEKEVLDLILAGRELPQMDKEPSISVTVLEKISQRVTEMLAGAISELDRKPR